MVCGDGGSVRESGALGAFDGRTHEYFVLPLTTDNRVDNRE